jgi:SnoaL-like polyketide cyclase
VPGAGRRLWAPLFPRHVERQSYGFRQLITPWRFVMVNAPSRAICLLYGLAPPTGKEVTVTGITYSRISDGQVRESWASWDTLSMLQQLGAVPEAAPTQN